MALHPAAGNLGNAASPEQHHPVDPHIMFFVHGPPDCPNHGLDTQRQSRFDRHWPEPGTDFGTKPVLELDM
jgi:hypothetical protein